MTNRYPRITRRRFLTESAIAGAGLLSWSAAIGLSDTARPVDPNRWVLLADTHLSHRRQDKHRGVVPAEGLTQAREATVALEPRPAGVVVCGDCAFGEGLLPDYVLLAEMIRPIEQAGISVHFALGNHDHRENFWKTFPARKPAGAGVMPDKHACVVESEAVNWFILDSLEKTNQTPGLLGKEQLDWLAAQLDARREKPALVVAHHNPDPTGKLNGLKDTHQLLDVLGSRKQVKAYVFGHTHRWQHATVRGLHLVNVPTTAGVFDPAQPRAWLDVRFRADGARLTVHCLDRAHNAEGQVVDLRW
jgi:hypothetical protein